MIEAGVVIGINGEPLHWHLPAGRSGGNLPDSRELWDVLWEAHQRKQLRGFAHSHPGSGTPSPSSEDVSTFVAIESALGQSFDWWITSSNETVMTRRAEMDSMPGRVVYSTTKMSIEPPWVTELRRFSEIASPYR